MVQTRATQQVLIHKLVMNPMREHTETSQIVAWSDDKEKLITFYNNEKVEGYSTEGHPSFECHGDSHKWHKSFKVGGMLEWFNPIDSFEQPNHYGQGLRQEWVDTEILGKINVGFRVW